jgi:hypothetical protein
VRLNEVVSALPAMWQLHRVLSDVVDDGDVGVPF